MQPRRKRGAPLSPLLGGRAASWRLEGWGEGLLLNATPPHPAFVASLRRPTSPLTRGEVE